MIGKFLKNEISGNAGKHLRLSAKMIRNRIYKRYDRQLGDKVIQYYEGRQKNLYQVD